MCLHSNSNIAISVVALVVLKFSSSQNRKFSIVSFRCCLLFQRHTIYSISLTPVSSSFSMSDQLPLDQQIVNRVAVSAKFVSDFNILYTQYFNGATCILRSGSVE